LAGGRQAQEAPPGNDLFDKGEVFEVVVGKVSWSFYQSPQDIDVACYARDLGTFQEDLKSERSLLCSFDTRYEPNRSNARPDTWMRIEKRTKRLESSEGEQYDGYMRETCVLSQNTHFAAYKDEQPVDAQLAWIDDSER
jgi:hypothetical protein